MDKNPNPLMQGTITEALSKVMQALNDTKDQFVIEDPEIQTVQLSIGMCRGIVEAFDLIIDALSQLKNYAPYDCSAHSKPEILAHSELLKEATALCDELDKLMAMHHFFYQAVEHFFPEKGLSFRHGLSLFPSWLRERDIDALDGMHNLQESLRACLKQYYT